jgi:hypothetical protein
MNNADMNSNGMLDAESLVSELHWHTYVENYERLLTDPMQENFSEHDCFQISHNREKNERV